MANKSKCLKCDYQSEFENNGNKFYNFLVEFEDGTKGSYTSSKKDDPKFKVGEEAEYEKEEKVFNGMPFIKVKPVYSQNGFNKAGNQKGIFACSALKEAVNFHSNNIGEKTTIIEVMNTALQFKNWLENNSK